MKFVCLRGEVRHRDCGVIAYWVYVIYTHISGRYYRTSRPTGSFVPASSGRTKKVRVWGRVHDGADGRIAIAPLLSQPSSTVV
jgi:hypothetical protein